MSNTDYFMIPDIDFTDFYKLPQLPMVTFNSGGIEYTYPNILLLNMAGVSAFVDVFRCMLDYPENGVKTIHLSKGVSDIEKEIIFCIVAGMKFKAKKKGRHGFVCDMSLITSSSIHEESIDFRWLPETARSISTYFHEKDILYSFSMEDIAKACCNYFGYLRKEVSICHE